MDKKRQYLALLLLLISFGCGLILCNGKGQAEEINIHKYCPFKHMPYKAIEPSPATLLAIDTITDTIGLSGDFKVIAGRFEKTTPLAAAFICQSNRYIIYDADRFKFLEKKKMDWQLLGVLIHEISHHANSHIFINNKPQRQQELEADYLAGFISGRLGASLEQATRFTDMLTKSGSDTHPPRERRRAEAIKGWTHATQQKRWEKSQCINSQWHGSNFLMNSKKCRIINLCDQGRIAPRVACKSSETKWVLQ